MWYSSKHRRRQSVAEQLENVTLVSFLRPFAQQTLYFLMVALLFSSFNGTLTILLVWGPRCKGPSVSATVCLSRGMVSVLLMLKLVIHHPIRLPSVMDLSFFE